MVKRLCAVEGCLDPHDSKGYCSAHYARATRYGRLVLASEVPLLDFVMERIKVTGEGCWHWTKGRSGQGYGIVQRGRRSATNRPRRAHRVTWELLVGPIPDGMDLDHLCHNKDSSCQGGATCPHRACCNPEHLEPVSRARNVRRGRSAQATRLRGAARTHCKNGHPLSGDNVRTNSKGVRICRTCQRRSALASYHRRAGSAEGS